VHCAGLAHCLPFPLSFPRISYRHRADLLVENQRGETVFDLAVARPVRLDVVEMLAKTSRALAQRDNAGTNAMSMIRSTTNSGETGLRSNGGGRKGKGKGISRGNGHGKEVGHGKGKGAVPTFPPLPERRFSSFGRTNESTAQSPDRGGGGGGGSGSGNIGHKLFDTAKIPCRGQLGVGEAMCRSPPSRLSLSPAVPAALPRLVARADPKPLTSCVLCASPVDFVDRFLFCSLIDLFVFLFCVCDGVCDGV
jgi:hypothetical protein